MSTNSTTDLLCDDGMSVNCKGLERIYVSWKRKPHTKNDYCNKDFIAN
jgi:hypothetical protein